MVHDEHKITNNGIETDDQAKWLRWGK